MECLSLETFQSEGVTQVTNPAFVWQCSVELLKVGESIRMISGRQSAAQLPGQGLLQMWLQVLFCCVPDSSPEVWAVQRLVWNRFLLGGLWLCALKWGGDIPGQLPEQGQGH